MLSIIKRLKSSDETTVKYVLELEDKNTIESVFIRFMTYDSLCISSQVGCKLKCKFCTTGLSGFARDLTSNEIVAQIENIFGDVGVPVRDFKVSFMGMGEPLLNLDAVLIAQESLKSSYPSVRFSLSTVGIVPKIYELTGRNRDMQLQVSLHAPNDRLREEIMPITKKYPIRDVLKAAKHYAQMSGKIFRINYLLFDGVNDSDVCANELVDLIRDLPAFLKISKFNSISEIELNSASNERHKAFEVRCSQAGIHVYQFSSMGVDVQGGCGQLRAHLSI